MLSKWSMVSSLGRNKSFSLEATKHSTVPSFNEFMLSNSIKRLSTEARMFSKKPRTSLAGASCKIKYIMSQLFTFKLLCNEQKKVQAITDYLFIKSK